MRTIDELSEEVDLLREKVAFVDGKEVGLADRIELLEEKVAKVEQQEIVWLKEKVAYHQTDIQRLFTKFANMEVGKRNAELQKSVTKKIIISLE